MDGRRWAKQVVKGIANENAITWLDIVWRSHARRPSPLGLSARSLLPNAGRCHQSGEEVIRIIPARKADKREQSLDAGRRTP